MIIASIALLAAQAITVPDAGAWTIDQRIAHLAESEASLATRIERPVLEDPAIRAEFRRIGFATGCSVFGQSRREVVPRHVPDLIPHFDAAIRKLIPAEQIAKARFLSFLASPLIGYHRRVADSAERTAEAELASATADLRTTFLSRTAAVQTNGDPAANVVVPRADIARALGVDGPWNLDNPNHVALACAEQLIPPDRRPLISGGGPARDPQRRD